MKARICIIGNGIFANRVHYPSLASFPDVEIAGIFAFNRQRLEETARHYNIPYQNIYAIDSRTGYQDGLLRLQPDGVYTIGPPEQMLDIWIWCLEQGFPLFIEKPMGLTLQQAELLARLAAANNCITQVSLQRRSSPLLRKMKEECMKKGAVTHALVEFSKYEIVPMKGARDRMLDDFVHCIDTARWICGGTIVKVESHCRRILTPDINWIGAHLFFDNGNTCHVIGNWSSGRRIFRVNMHAPGICAEADLEKEARIFIEGDTGGIVYSSQAVAGSDELYVYGGFRQKNREFIDSVLSSKEQTSSPFHDVLKTMKTAELILAQYLVANAIAI